MSESAEWTNEAVILMIQEYQKRAELWKRDHNLHRVQTAKNMAWKSIAKMLNCDIPDVRKKFNSVMASYRRERTKVKEGGRSFWFLYPYMSFFPGYEKSPGDERVYLQEDVPIQYEEIETLDETYNMDSDGFEPSEQIIDEVIIKHEPQIQAFTHDDYIIPNKISSTGSTGSTNKRKLMRSIKRKPKRIISSKANERPFGTKEYVDKKIQEVTRMANKSIPKKDDCDTYGEYIASTLRKHNNKTQCLIKQAINNILFEQEMQRYENPDDSDILRSTLNSDTKFKN